MSNIKWRFPGNNYTNDNGLDTADMETFKKDAISSLARELCQNSIDAKRKELVTEPVKIEFKSFEINREKIPGIDDIEHQIQNCYDTWNTPDYKGKMLKQLEEMKEQVQKPKIMCLRISDFNTTGLIGVSGSDKSPWRYLVHGSGISDKGATSGGSKGIGKFATFVTSHFNTVFYSTKTVKNETGYEGICKLCSAKMPNTTEKTQGIGYYGSSDKNEPNPGELYLDDTFKRNECDFGSDVYILGFKNPTGWRQDIISKILDSFISAIVFGTLEVTVDDVIINSETLGSIVYDDSLINTKLKKSIISQYLLLTDKDHRFVDTISMDELGNAKLYLMEFDEEHEDLATNSCVMIRYPYMKIKSMPKISTLPCSAMCIIENNDLNKMLRNIENPQHTDWEFNRLENEAERAEVRAIYNELRDKIVTIITNHLASSDNTKTDVEGAGDYIPGVETGINDGTNNVKTTISEKPSIKKNKVKTTKPNITASIPDEEGDGISLDIGSSGEEGETTIMPEGSNEGAGRGVVPGSNEGQGKTTDNGSIIVKPAELRGMSYIFVCLSKKEGKYGISFVSDFTEEDVSLELFALDHAGGRYPVEIYSCNINGKVATVENGKMIRFSLKHGEKYTFVMETDQQELFSGEVKVYAYR